MVGTAIICVSIVLFVFVNSFETVLFVAILTRTGSNFYHPVGTSAVSKNFQGEAVDRAIGFQATFDS